MPDSMTGKRGMMSKGSLGSAIPTRSEHVNRITVPSSDILSTRPSQTESAFLSNYGRLEGSGLRTTHPTHESELRRLFRWLSLMQAREHLLDDVHRLVDQLHIDGVREAQVTLAVGTECRTG